MQGRLGEKPRMRLSEVGAISTKALGLFNHCSSQLSTEVGKAGMHLQ
jgi:hypothetical protein